MRTLLREIYGWPFDDCCVRGAFVAAEETREPNEAIFEKLRIWSYKSVFPRVVLSERGRVRRPRPRGDHGMEPTPNAFMNSSVNRVGKYRTQRGKTCLQGWEHFALFFTIDQAIMILHRDERGQFVLNGIVYDIR